MFTQVGNTLEIKNLKYTRSHSVALHMHFGVIFVACLYYKMMFNPNFHVKLLSQEKKFSYRLI